MNCNSSGGCIRCIALMGGFMMFGLVSFADEPPALTQLRQAYEKEVEATTRPITDRYRQQLDALLKSLTQSGQVEAATAVQSEINRIGGEKETATHHQTTKGKITLAITVDGADYIFVKSDELWIEHVLDARPSSIIVNSQPWMPQWQGEKGETSERLKLPGLFLQPSSGAKVSLKVKGRGTARILEQPSEKNEWQLKIGIEDPEAGSSEYTLTISW